MEDTNLHIHDLIVHKVDHKERSAPQLAGRRTPTNADVESFLKRHIKNNISSKNTRTARFTPPEGTDVVLRKVCYSLLQEEDQFVPSSQQIASHLFAAVENDRRISPSELVICTYSSSKSNGSTAARHVAILKMDPSEGFTTKEEVMEGGAVRYVLEQVPEVLPITDLQKCAFVLPHQNEEEYDLQVLDQQISTFRQGKAAASFFTRDFLQCEVNYNAADRTKIYHRESLAYAAQKEEEGAWSADQSELFRERINDSLRDDRVDIVALANRTIDDEEERQEYLQNLGSQGLDTVLDPDPDVSKRVTQHRTFVGDHDLKLRISADAYENRVEVEKDEVTGEKIVTIRTDQWEETS